MNKNDKLIITVGVIIILVASIGVYLWTPGKSMNNILTTQTFLNVSSSFLDVPDAIVVPDSNPFFALIATPLAIHYDNMGNQEVIPLYVKNFTDRSRAIERVEQQVGIYADYIVSDNYSPKEVSLSIAKTFWNHSSAALVLGDNDSGYELGVVATPLASYLSIPIIVTDVIDKEVRQVFQDLGVTDLIVCGNFGIYGNSLKFDNVHDIINATIEIVQQKFGDLNYITLANPLDVTEPTVIERVSYHFEGTVSSSAFTPTHMVNMIIGCLTGAPITKIHEFEVPSNYTYARIRIHAKNFVDEDPEETGSQLYCIPYDSEGNRLALAFTVGGIPVRNSEGGIELDRIQWDTIVYNQPGLYSLMMQGNFMASKRGDYEVDVIVENLDTSIVPGMKGLSSVAPYLTAYHQGVMIAKPDFAFAAHEGLVLNPASGVVYPASNPGLIDDSNRHTFKIHELLNHVLAQIVDIELNSEEDLKSLTYFYDENPVYIAIVGDSVMVPQYYYYDTPDAVTIYFGWDVASDFIYGNIDPVPRNDIISIHPKDQFSSSRYEDELYPNQENFVGRITGWDVQDANALIIRSIFYNNIIDNIENSEWKSTATVQTGAGTDFQRIPGIDLIRKILGAHELPVKWPTGLTHFENMMISDIIQQGHFNVRSTENIESGRKGFSIQTLNQISSLGVLNRVLFPKARVMLLAGEDKVTGGQNQQESNFIFSFGHGQPMGFKHSDIQLEAMGFRPVLLDNLMNRVFMGTFIPALNSGLGNVGAYHVRYVENMNLGPSVMFVESCYVGRIDGFPATSCISQAYLHAGLNTLVASSRGSPGPGYLDARTRPLGFGLKEYIQTRRNPDLQDLHFSGLIAGNMFEDLIENNVAVGEAFRNARNKFMDDANSTFFWTPPLSLDVQTVQDLGFFLNTIRPTSGEDDARCMEKKYTCMLEYNLFGDPAFNPYEPVNDG